MQISWIQSPGKRADVLPHALDPGLPWRHRILNQRRRQLAALLFSCARREVAAQHGGQAAAVQIVGDAPAVVDLTDYVIEGLPGDGAFFWGVCGCFWFGLVELVIGWEE